MLQIWLRLSIGLRDRTILNKEGGDRIAVFDEPKADDRIEESAERISHELLV
jgi:hypothetical protein